MGEQTGKTTFSAHGARTYIHYDMFMRPYPVLPVATRLSQYNYRAYNDIQTNGIEFDCVREVPSVRFAT